jgi:nitrogen-specific signal transduction histidine kinase
MFLSTYDPLTGLYNYETYHKQLDYLIHSKFPFILIHIDCTDLKSMNSKQGFEEGKGHWRTGCRYGHEIRNPLTTIKGFLQISKNHQYNIEPWYNGMLTVESEKGIGTVFKVYLPLDR